MWSTGAGLPADAKVYGLVKGSPEAIAKLLQEKPLVVVGGDVCRKKHL